MLWNNFSELSDLKEPRRFTIKLKIFTNLFFYKVLTIYYLFPYHQEEWNIFRSKVSPDTWCNKMFNLNSISSSLHEIFTKIIILIKKKKNLRFPDNFIHDNSRMFNRQRSRNNVISKINIETKSHSPSLYSIEVSRYSNAEGRSLITFSSQCVSVGRRQESNGKRRSRWCRIDSKPDVNRALDSPARWPSKRHSRAARSRSLEWKKKKKEKKERGKKKISTVPSSGSHSSVLKRDSMSISGHTSHTWSMIPIRADGCSQLFHARIERGTLFRLKDNALFPPPHHEQCTHAKIE